MSSEIARGMNWFMWVAALFQFDVTCVGVMQKKKKKKVVSILSEIVVFFLFVLRFCNLYFDCSNHFKKS